MKRKVLLSILIFFTSCITSLLVLPIIFQKKIQDNVEKFLKQNIQAETKMNSLSLGFLKKFPHFNIAFNNFVIASPPSFPNTKLIELKSLDLQIKFWKFLFKKEFHIKHIRLNQPKIYLRVDQKGTTNFQIMKTNVIKINKIHTPEATLHPISSQSNNEHKPESPLALLAVPLNIGIDKFSIYKGYILYENKLDKTFLECIDLTHLGKGKWSKKNIQWKTTTNIEAATIQKKQFYYLYKKDLQLDFNILIDLLQSKCILKESKLKLSKFEIQLLGDLFLYNSDEYYANLQWLVPHNSLKDLLTCLPNLYQKHLFPFKTEGKANLKGTLKGKGSIQNNYHPAFHFCLNVFQGRLTGTGPNYKSTIDNFNMKLLITKPVGELSKTIFDLQNFQCTFETGNIFLQTHIQNPFHPYIHSKLHIENFDFHTLQNLIPLNFVENWAGKCNLDMTIDGSLDVKNKIFPKQEAKLQIVDMRGKYLYQDHENKVLPILFKDFFLDLHTSSCPEKTGFKLQLDQFNIVVPDYIPFLSFKGCIQRKPHETFHINLNTKTKFLLDKISTIYPMTNKSIKGNVEFVWNINDVLQLQQLNLLENILTQLPLRESTLQMKDIQYTDEELTQTVFIPQANFLFAKDKLQIKNLQTKIGKTNLSCKGSVENYLIPIKNPKHLAKNEKIKIICTLHAPLVEGNELAKLKKIKPVAKKIQTENKLNKVNSTSDINTPKFSLVKEEKKSEMIEFPEYLDVTLNKTIEKLVYNQLVITQLNAKTHLSQGRLKINPCDFKIFDGQVSLSSTYTPLPRVKKNTFNVDLNISKLKIDQIYQSLDIIQKFLPIAGNVQGNVSGKLNLNGETNPMNKLIEEQLKGKGEVQLHNTTINTSENLKAILKAGQLNQMNQIIVDQTRVQFEIQDGQLITKPFVIKIDDNPITISGKNNLQGILDYRVMIPVQKYISESLGGLLNNLGLNTTGVLLKLGINGHYNNPNINVLGIEQDPNQQKNTPVQKEKPILPKEKEITNKVQEKKKELLNSLGKLF